MLVTHTVAPYSYAIFISVQLEGNRCAQKEKNPNSIVCRAGSTVINRSTSVFLGCLRWNDSLKETAPWEEK